MFLPCFYRFSKGVGGGGEAEFFRLPFGSGLGIYVFLNVNTCRPGAGARWKGRARCGGPKGVAGGRAAGAVGPEPVGAGDAPGALFAGTEELCPCDWSPPHRGKERGVEEGVAGVAFLLLEVQPTVAPK